MQKCLCSDVYSEGDCVLNFGQHTEHSQSLGVPEGLKELKSKHLTWKKVIQNRLGVFATPMSYRDPKTW